MSTGNRHWIKLWLSILDDPKMGGLRCELWRLAVELFLVAGENGNDGVLPDVPSLAWRLRRDTESVTELMVELESTNIIKKLKVGYVVSKFKKRQSAVPDKLRQKAYRKNALETNLSRSVERTEKKKNKKQNRKYIEAIND